ncbi:LysR family transcriptional regulator [Ruegeria sp. A3M17]|uniref:LysR family transcriptional regulator n=1 Tax=Ruegeria sp. A3M17 TaxID=2267229 RepID=UPI000DEA364A|nr:LysR family transcriptional regulator [Ruegeria sp. A3M17]RBW61845.1 LysR family transcriptional regulator [Ruegeria sp. A3M17]
MKKFNIASLDGQLLITFLTVLEESSVSKAGIRLGVTQSTVSHALVRLRDFFDDPLFVRSGQAMLPTDRANSLRIPVQNALDALQKLTFERRFEPETEDLFFIVAANDMQRDLIFPKLLRELRDDGVSAAFEFIPSGHPTSGMMREARCHLALTPFPPDATDIVQKPILHGQMMCFFDGAVRKAPATWEEYCQADHLTVRFPDGGTSLRALTGVDKSGIREARISVPNFSAIPSFVKGSDYLATEMNLMKLSVLSELEMAPLPNPSDSLTIYMSWHQRSTNDPAHSWLREKISSIADEVMETVATS